MIYWGRLPFVLFTFLFTSYTYLVPLVVSFEPIFWTCQFCCPANWLSFVTLPLRPILNQKITCLHHNYSTSSGQFNNRIYFTFLSHLQANGRNLKHKNVFMFQRIWILIASKLIFCLDKTPTYLGSSSSINNSVWLCRWTVV